MAVDPIFINRSLIPPAVLGEVKTSRSVGESSEKAGLTHSALSEGSATRRKSRPRDSKRKVIRDESARAAAVGTSVVVVTVRLWGCRGPTQL